MIQGIKLNNGTELIADVLGVSSDSIRVSHPVELVLGKGGFNMLPSSFIAEDMSEMEINLASVMMYPYKINSAIEEQYKSLVTTLTTGIEVPSKQILI